MQDKLFILGKIISLIIFILAFSLMGLASGKPIMVLAYAGFFAVVVFVIFLFVKKSQRHFEIISQQSPIMRKILGIVLLPIAILLPVLSVSSFQLFELTMEKISIGIYALIVLITLVLIGAGIFAVSLINRTSGNKVMKILGYLILVVISAVPALMVMPYDKTTVGIGSVYYVAILVAVLGWWGINLYLNKE